MATVAHLFKDSPVPEGVPEAERWRYFVRELKVSVGKHPHPPGYITKTHKPTAYLKEARWLHTSARQAYWTDELVPPVKAAMWSVDVPSPNADRVENELWKYYERSRPTEMELRARAHALAKIRWVVRNFAEKNGLVKPGKADVYAVEPFGSTLIGVDRANADLDLVVLDPSLPDGFKPGIKYKKEHNCLYDVQALAKALQKHGCINIEAVPRARVPIVRGAVVDPKTSFKIEFDLCVNSRNGLYNSRLLAAYAELDPRVRPLLVILKRWATKSGLDHPVKLMKKRRGRVIAIARSWSSYTMGQLVIAFMQHSGLLPNLQEPFIVPLKEKVMFGGPMGKAPYMLRRLPGDESMPDVYWSISNGNPDLRIPSDVRFLDPKSEPVQEWMAARDEMLQRLNRQWSLTELLQQFFLFYCGHFKYPLWAVSVRDGGIVQRLVEPGFRPPERLFQELLRDLRIGKHRDPPAASTNTEGDDEEAVPLREGDSREMDDYIARDLALLLASPTDLNPWRKRPLVIVDPIVRANNISQQVSEKDIKQFIAECGRAAEVLRLGLGLDDLMSRASKSKSGFERKKGKKK
ncbi:Nucleotidyltransferase [Auricularia subglabra TFB-10046 SS5]|uniref:Nucleotidyltransferase n=1 Tax=Auricularia subglabra (strain TFB-10046 / SS5) TaxID=717982 RepID=J0WYH3_AURST|nr:Nucleotidyltransferase [Auricularia subglabra TFB-10046 SS5]